MQEEMLQLSQCHEPAVSTPPQLWEMELVQDDKVREQFSHVQVTRLFLHHTYLPKAQVDIAGSRDHQLMSCAGKAGDIHIWDCNSIASLHVLQEHLLAPLLSFFSYASPSTLVPMRPPSLSSTTLSGLPSSPPTSPMPASFIVTNHALFQYSLHSSRLKRLCRV
ncbi:hypothetical protein BDR07DRAFT_1498229 [Suillus spraguei]|nr:hypothetical protein BDR07DRAFT_1498229 [Suillus spraguei]